MSLAITHYTLVYPVHDSKILLATQISGKWKGYLNGFGGKLQNNEVYSACAQRELKEETGLVAENGDLILYGRIRYRHLTDGFASGSVCVFFYVKWDGKLPIGGELEQSFIRVEKDKIPYRQLPPDDHIWLPKMLEGKYVEAELTYETRHEETLLKMVEFNTAFL